MSVSTEPKKRRAWLAALLSLLMPGLGQLYNRQVRLALVLMILGFLLAMPARWAIAAAPTELLVSVAAVILACGLAVPLFAIVQAAIGARRAGSISLAWFNRWFVYVGLIVLVTIWGFVAEMLPIPSITNYNIPSGSMVPTLLVGDYLEARTLAFDDQMPVRGEIAVFRTPAEPDVDFVHRIIGLPGDRIQLREGRLYLNGTLVERVPLSETEAAPLAQQLEDLQLYRETLPGGVSYLIAEVSDNGGLDNTPEFVVPEDHVFVLGDNRDGANDSRAGRGFIPIAGLRDKPLFIYWSADKSRIGKMPE
jgi:signal peptidase I